MQLCLQQLSEKIYISFTRPIFENACVVWDPAPTHCYDLTEMGKFQISAPRIITASLHRHACVRVGVWQCSPTVYRPGSVWNCLWGNALKRSPGIIRKSRVSYPGPGFLSSATWPSLPKKHYNGLNQNHWYKRLLI